METKFDIVDEYSIGIKCLFCKHDKLQFPIFVACKPGDYSFLRLVARVAIRRITLISILFTTRLSFP